MKFLTGYYCCANLHSALVLQQVTRRKGKLPIVFAFVWKSGDGCDKEDNDVARKVTEWFYEEALQGCIKGVEADCIDTVGRKFEAKAQNIKGEFAALFAVGSECFYAWKGDVQIHLLNLQFNKLHKKSLTYSSETMCMERAQIEAGVGVLLENNCLFKYLPAQLLKECLNVNALQSNEQVERHLREACKAAIQYGDREVLAVLVVVRGA